MRKLITLALALLVGCVENKSDSETAGDGMIILSCTGVLADEKDMSTKNVSYLIKAKDQGTHSSLLYYSDTEKRFDPSRCSRNTYDCLSVSTPDQIEEHGTVRGSGDSVILVHKTTINRRTGKMASSVIFNNSAISAFEGVCVKAESPIEAPQKF